LAAHLAPHVTSNLATNPDGGGVVGAAASTRPAGPAAAEEAPDRSDAMARRRAMREARERAQSQ
jgi:hypothetical protein